MPRKLNELEGLCLELAQKRNITINKARPYHLNGMHRVNDFIECQKYYQRWDGNEVFLAGRNETLSLVYCAANGPRDESQVSEIFAVEDRQRMITIIPTNGGLSNCSNYKVYVDDLVVNKALVAIPGAGIDLSGLYQMWEISEIKNFLREILDINLK